MIFQIGFCDTSAYSALSLLLEEKVSPVRTLVTDVVENVTISLEVP